MVIPQLASTISWRVQGPLYFTRFTRETAESLLKEDEEGVEDWDLFLASHRSSHHPASIRKDNGEKDSSLHAV